MKSPIEERCLARLKIACSEAVHGDATRLPIEERAGQKAEVAYSGVLQEEQWWLDSVT